MNSLVSSAGEPARQMHFAPFRRAWRMVRSRKAVMIGSFWPGAAGRCWWDRRCPRRLPRTVTPITPANSPHPRAEICRREPARVGTALTTISH